MYYFESKEHLCNSAQLGFFITGWLTNFQHPNKRSPFAKYIQ